MERDYKKPTVSLTKESGNSFAIIGRVSRALIMAGASRETVRKYLDEATSRDYRHLLWVTTQYVNTGKKVR